MFLRYTGILILKDLNTLLQLPSRLYRVGEVELCVFDLLGQTQVLTLKSGLDMFAVEYEVLGRKRTVSI